MSDEKLEAYIKTIEPNFNSHLEKGTIEMSNEYFNLLEERMARLINENQELNKQLDEKDILIKQYDSIVQKTENQQKEFISYLEKIIKELECDDVDDEEMKGYLIQRIDTFKEILSKYKEIIGGKDENTKD